MGNVPGISLPEWRIEGATNPPTLSWALDQEMTRDYLLTLFDKLSVVESFTLDLTPQETVVLGNVLNSKDGTPLCPEPAAQATKLMKRMLPERYGVDSVRFGENGNWILKMEPGVDVNEFDATTFLRDLTKGLELEVQLVQEKLDSISAGMQPQVKKERLPAQEKRFQLHRGFQKFPITQHPDELSRLLNEDIFQLLRLPDEELRLENEARFFQSLERIILADRPDFKYSDFRVLSQKLIDTLSHDRFTQVCPLRRGCVEAELGAPDTKLDRFPQSCWIILAVLVAATFATGAFIGYYKLTHVDITGNGGTTVTFRRAISSGNCVLL